VLNLVLASDVVPTDDVACQSLLHYDINRLIFLLLPSISVPLLPAFEVFLCIHYVAAAAAATPTVAADDDVIVNYVDEYDFAPAASFFVGFRN